MPLEFGDQLIPLGGGWDGWKLIRAKDLDLTAVAGCDENIATHTSEVLCDAGATDHTDNSTGHWVEPQLTTITDDDIMLIDNGAGGTQTSTRRVTALTLKNYAIEGVSGTTNLDNSADGDGLTIESSSGTNTDLPVVTESSWGVVSDELCTTWNSKASQSGTTGSSFYDR